MFSSISPIPSWLLDDGESPYSFPLPTNSVGDNDIGNIVLPLPQPIALGGSSSNLFHSIEETLFLDVAPSVTEAATAHATSLIGSSSTIQK